MRLALPALLLPLLLSCNTGPTFGTNDELPPTCAIGVRCADELAISCSDGVIDAVTDCAEDGLSCAVGLGCVECQPGDSYCDGDQSFQCRADGMGFEMVEDCSLIGEPCDADKGVCYGPCEEAIDNHSYLGCEYWPVVTANSQLDDTFRFAVTVANPQEVDVTVVLEQLVGGLPRILETITVSPESLRVVELPWVESLKGEFLEEASARVPGGAFRLVSDLPVVVSQFNPLNYRRGDTYSFTNDASRLLPAHVLTGNYLVMSRAHLMLDRTGFGISDSPGFFSLTGIDWRPSTVEIEFSAFTQASVDGALAAYAPGDRASFQLRRGEVLQFVSAPPAECAPDSPTEAGVTYCRTGPQRDLSGTAIETDGGRVQVLSGHNCAFVPFNRWACDHLEEALFPVDTWGSRFAVAISEPLRDEPNLIRVMAGKESTFVSFTPEVFPTTELQRGEWVEFAAYEDFVVESSSPVMVGQFLVGQDYAGLGTSGEAAVGDPSFSLAVPVEQYRPAYTFLAPQTYSENWLLLTAPLGTFVELNGERPEGNWLPIGDSGMAAMRVPIPGGTNRISANAPVGIVVYGYGNYTSYMYPGGLELAHLQDPSDWE